MIEYVVGIGTDLHADLLPDGKCLAQREVDPAESRTSQLISSLSPESAGGGNSEGCFVEPLMGVTVREAWISNWIWKPGKVATGQRVRVVHAEDWSEGLSTLHNDRA